MESFDCNYLPIRLLSQSQTIVKPFRNQSQSNWLITFDTQLKTALMAENDLFWTLFHWVLEERRARRKQTSGNLMYRKNFCLKQGNNSLSENLSLTALTWHLNFLLNILMVGSGGRGGG